MRAYPGRIRTNACSLRGEVELLSSVETKLDRLTSIEKLYAKFSPNSVRGSYGATYRKSGGIKCAMQSREECKRRFRKDVGLRALNLS